MDRNCDYIPANELLAMTDRELITHLRKCEKVLSPVKNELQRRRDIANTSCPI